jgi:hypothetical protein
MEKKRMNISHQYVIFFSIFFLTQVILVWKVSIERKGLLINSWNFKVESMLLVLSMLIALCKYYECLNSSYLADSRKVTF